MYAEFRQALAEKDSRRDDRGQDQAHVESDEKAVGDVSFKPLVHSRGERPVPDPHAVIRDCPSICRGTPESSPARCQNHNPAKSQKKFSIAMSRNLPQLRLHYESAEKGAKLKRRRDMKYILMMNTMKAGSQSQAFVAWPKKDIQAHIAFMIKFDKELRAEGTLVSAEGLAFPDQAKLVRAGADGTPITDGVFPESKEFLAGYWIVEVESPEQAYAIAARASAAPGVGGKPVNMPIEVRQVMSGPPEEFQ
jgi:hypothetical protein